MNAQTHDFRDGNGPVPAHRHTNGGGWVANTAHVHNSAYIGPDARVYGNARVSGDAWVKRGVYTSTPDEAKAHWGHPEHHKHRESMAIVTALNAIADLLMP